MLRLIFDNARKSAKQKILQKLNGEAIISADGRIAFLIDTSQNILYVVDTVNQIHKYKKDDILEIKMESVDEKGYKQSLFSTLLWFEIGKIIDRKNDLHEVLPRIVTDKEIIRTQKIFLRIMVKDYKYPFFDLIVFENGIFSSKKEGYNIAIRWYSLLNVLKNT